MRVWLYNRILALPGIPAAFGNPRRVVSSSAADQPVKPFLLVSMGNENKVLGSTREMRVQNIPFTVYCHDVPGSFVAIDDAAVALKNNLPIEGAVVGGMSVYTLEWTDTGEDGYDDHFKTNVRPVRFNIVSRAAAG